MTERREGGEHFAAEPRALDTHLTQERLADEAVVHARRSVLNH